LKSVGPQRYQAHLHSTLQLLCEDKETSVRERVASGFHEVTSILVHDKKSVVSLKKIFLKLLRVSITKFEVTNCSQDKDIKVRDKIVSRMSNVFNNFKMSSTGSQSEELFSSIITSLVKYQACIKNDWRRLDSFYAHFENFHLYFTTEQLATVLIPMLKEQIVSSGAIPVKEKASNAIVIMIRYTKNVTKQVELLNDLWREMGENKSYWHRMTYLDIFRAIWKHFSRRFVKDHVFSDIMKLSSDSVPNVRIKFCTLLPELKQVLQLPNDVQLLATLKETVSYLTLDKDRDVIQAAQKAQQQLLAIDNEINRGHRLNLQTSEDRLDNDKEREETMWMEIELENERNRKRVEAIAQVNSSNADTKVSTDKGSGQIGSNGTTGTKTVPKTQGPSKQPVRPNPKLTSPPSGNKTPTPPNPTKM
jgi:hypothetical protein